MKVKPILKWAGGKYASLGKLLSVFPEAKRLIEPFAGSGVVFMNTDYSNYIIGDENKDLVNFFNHLKDHNEDFIAYCSEFFHERYNNNRTFYLLRDEFNKCTDPQRRAALFLYLNRHGYNGLCRYNQQGIYNVPFGRYNRPYFPSQEMAHFTNKCQRALFMHNDFRKTFEYAEKGDLIYCDPPYSPINQKSNFSAYTAKKFGEEEHIVLAELAMEYAKRGVITIISNHDTEFTRHHYRFAKTMTFKVRRFINCVPNNRQMVSEIIAVFS